MSREGISVIVPTFNRAHLVTRAISSILAQTYTSWELIIVDDGSSDNTTEAVLPFVNDRVIYVEKENSGAAHSRNVGVDNASMPYITFLDSDDEAVPGWLEKIMHAVSHQDAAVVCCGLRRFDHTGKLVDEKMPKDMGPMFDNAVARFTNGGVFALKKEIFNAVGGFDTELRSGQHTELAMRVIPYVQKNKLKVVNIFEPLIRVHIHLGERIRQNWESVFLGSTRTLARHEELFRKDRKLWINYLSVAAVCAARTRRYSEAKHYFFEAVKKNPASVKLWGRLLLANVPGLRSRVWKGKKA